MTYVKLIPFLCGVLFVRNFNANNVNFENSEYEEINCTMKNVYFGSAHSSVGIDYKTCYKRIVEAKIAENLNNYRIVFNDMNFGFKINSFTISFFESYLNEFKNLKNSEYDPERVKALEGFISDMKLLRGNYVHAHINLGCIDLWTKQEFYRYIEEFGKDNIDIGMRYKRNSFWDKFI